MANSETPRGRGPALAVASAGYFFVLLDVMIVNVALARIARGLGGSRSELQWVVDAYALVLAAGMLGMGDLVDRAGSRRLFLGGLVVFGGASTLCALAPDAGILIAGRAVQGLGAAAILPSSLAIVNQLFPDPRERPRAIGIWAGIGGSALVLGQVLGGFLIEPLGWQSIFWLNVPLVIVAVVGGFLTLPEGERAKGARPDLWGQGLGTAALAALVFALIEGGKGGFARVPVVAGLAVSVASFAGFLAVEARLSAAGARVPAASAHLTAAIRWADEAGTGSAPRAPRPLIDLGWFRRTEFIGANAGASLMNLGNLGGLFALGLYLQQGEDLAPLEAGLALVPIAAPFALLTPFAGRLVGHVGPRHPAGLGLLATGAAYLGLALVSPSSLDTPIGWVLLALAGTGMAVATPALVAGATEALGRDRAGIASAVNNTCRQVGGAIGVALIGGLTSISASLAFTAASLLLGGTLALTLMGRAVKPSLSDAKSPRHAWSKTRSMTEQCSTADVPGAATGTHPTESHHG